MNEKNKTWDLHDFIHRYPQHKYIFEEWYGKDRIENIANLGSLSHYIDWRYYTIELANPNIDPEKDSLSFDESRITHPTKNSDHIVLYKKEKNLHNL